MYKRRASCLNSNVVEGEGLVWRDWNVLECWVSALINWGRG